MFTLFVPYPEFWTVRNDDLLSDDDNDDEGDSDNKGQYDGGEYDHDKDQNNEDNHNLWEVKWPHVWGIFFLPLQW